ncbi:UNVERIFIED_CONTAM: thymidylate synthase, flavin-dependent [Euhalothece sp. KZN 001]
MSITKSKGQTIPVLDQGKGFIRLIDWMGDDLTVVNAARVSFKKQKYTLDEKDVKLIKFLKENKHESPFRHPQIALHIKAPECVARQLYKHVVGLDATSEHSTKDHAWNEVSRRYITMDDFYTPDFFRVQSDSNKQGSKYDGHGNPVTYSYEVNEDFIGIWQELHKKIYDEIRYLIENGVAKEQAQMLLPLSFYTEWHWTASLQALLHLCDLRCKQDVQWETREYAEVIKDILTTLFPIVAGTWFNTNTEEK